MYLYIIAATFIPYIYIYIYIYSLKHQCFTNFFQTEHPKLIFHTLKNLAYENNDRPEKVYIYKKFTFIYIKFIYIYIKVKQSHYRPGVTQRVPGI